MLRNPWLNTISSPTKLSHCAQKKNRKRNQSITGNRRQFILDIKVLFLQPRALHIHTPACLTSVVCSVVLTNYFHFSSFFISFYWVEAENGNDWQRKFKKIDKKFACKQIVTCFLLCFLYNYFFKRSKTKNHILIIYISYATYSQAGNWT